MLFFVRAVVGVTTRGILLKESERRLRFATDRFQTRIREVDVILRDVNGPQGGIDKLCRVTARLHKGGTVQIEETRENFVSAIRAAAKRLRSALSRRLGGKVKAAGVRRKMSGERGEIVQ